MTDKGWAISILLALAMVLGAVVFLGMRSCDQQHERRLKCLELGGTIWGDECLFLRDGARR